MKADPSRLNNINSIAERIKSKLYMPKDVGILTDYCTVLIAQPSTT